MNLFVIIIVTILLSGPFISLERFIAGQQKEPMEFSVSEVLDWTDTAALPLLPA